MAARTAALENQAYVREGPGDHSCNVPVGVNKLLLPGDTQLLNSTYVLVYSLGDPQVVEQKYPGNKTLFDANGSVYSLSFTDQDLDFHELGGTLTWRPPLPHHVELVTHYEVYLADEGRGRRRLNCDNRADRSGKPQLCAELQRWRLGR